MGVLLLCLATFFFTRTAAEDLEAALDGVAEDFMEKMEFIADGAVSMRHSAAISNFLTAGGASEDADGDLSTALDLFSRRNAVSENLPFVETVHVFAPSGDFLRASYYSQALADVLRTDAIALNLALVFFAGGRRISVSRSDGALNLLFYLYGDDMAATAICVLRLNAANVRSIMLPLNEYRRGAWLISAGSDGTAALLASDFAPDFDADGSMLVARRACPFGLTVVAGAGRENAWRSLTPLLVVLALAVAASMLLVAFGSASVSRALVMPVVEIARGMQAFGKGDRAMRMRGYDIVEFNDISAAFNKMADRIIYLIEQVYEKQALAAESQVKFLQAQLNPHFMFNTLAMLALKAKAAGNDGLYDSLNAFSKLLRAKIYRNDEMMTRLSDEMEMADFYMALQKERFGNKIDWQLLWEDESLKDCLVPRLLVEPLVENAVTHGLEPKAGKGFVRARVWRNGDALCIAVEDDGVGFDAFAPPQGGPSSAYEAADGGRTHTSIENARRLLTILYGGDFTFSIKGKKGKGTRAELSLPLRHQQE